MVGEEPKLLTLIKDEFERRKAKNESYSLRAFAKSVNISVSVLSDFFNRKSFLSKSNIQKAVTALNLQGVDADFAKQRFSIDDSSYKLISEADFQKISGWQHFAILCLADLQGNQSDPQWISERLNISIDEARECTDRLIRLGLLAIEGLRMKGTGRNLRTPSDVQSAALRKLQFDHLELAKHALDKISLEYRDLTSISLVMNVGSVKEAKTMIKEFRRKFCKKYESDTAKDVYTLAVQLFPLTQITME